jgi:xanthine dehydrogenase YagR molybdenum-binding subunit
MSALIGKPLSRLEGVDKVTGQARYSADTQVAGILYASIVPATHAHAHIERIDTSAAAAAGGIVKIFTHLNLPRFGDVSALPVGQQLLPLQGDLVQYEGQPVALVIAETLEHASEAARLVRVTYRRLSFETDFNRRLDQGEKRPIFFWEPDSNLGDTQRAWANADVKLQQAYRTADRHHNPMEPAATLAFWDGDTLVLHDSVQGVMTARDVIAKALGIDPVLVRVRNDYVGGGFGCKGWVWPHQLLTAMAVRELRRPVRLSLSRANSYTAHGYQPASIQQISLSAANDGALTGIRHDSRIAGSYVGNHVEGTGIGTRSLYACASIGTSHRLVRVHRGDPTPMRAPLEGVGLVAVEIAMDELAYELKMDPLALRLKNYAEVDPSDGKPFSSKKLRECYTEGARRIGWAQRNPKPRSMRDGADLVGYGMATALFTAFRQPANARISIDRGGVVLVETSTQEIGTGSRTILPQIAADVLGLPAERVQLAWGDTTLPAAPMTAGSTSSGSVGSAVFDAATKLQARLAAAGATSASDYTQAVARSGAQRISADGVFAPPQDTPQALFSFGAIFAEVRVDAEIPIPRVSRIVGVYHAGRIINPKTARSQMIGGLTWGIGQALLEQSEMDHRNGRFLAKNLAGYLLPVNADVGVLDVAFIDEPDPHMNPLGVRGIGELGAIGVGAAIANALFHATGIRARDLPIRPEHLMRRA